MRDGKWPIVGVVSCGGYIVESYLIGGALTVMAARRRAGFAQVIVPLDLPGTVDTVQSRRDMPDAQCSCWVAPMDLAAAVLFLASVEGTCRERRRVGGFRPLLSSWGRPGSARWRGPTQVWASAISHVHGNFHAEAKLGSLRSFPFHFQSPFIQEVTAYPAV